MSEEIVEAFAEAAHDAAIALERIGDALVDEPDALPVAQAIQWGLRQVAEAITAPAAPGRDATGGTVVSLTEAVMGITAGLVQVAEALRQVAEAVENSGRGSAAE